MRTSAGGSTWAERSTTTTWRNSASRSTCAARKPRRYRIQAVVGHDGSLGAGRIVGYAITYNSTYANATRVMSDGRLVYEQQFILEAGKPYIRVYLIARNNTTETLGDVWVALAFDEMDREHYQAIYLPGVGLLNASASGEGFYDIAYSWSGRWSPANGWLIALLYSNKPLGANRGLAILFKAGSRVHVQGYGSASQQHVKAPGEEYFKRVEFEVELGDLAPHESRSLEVRIVPMASYAPGLEDLYVDMLSHIDEFDGRDFSYAITTGTGAFKGVALMGVYLAPLNRSYYEFARRVVLSAGTVMRRWGWRVSTRVLANYIEALLTLYEYSHDEALLEDAREAAGTLLSAQVRDPGDPRNGGFLDLPPPLGAAAYLDVGSEAAHALLMLYNATGDPKYREAVDYWLNKWFHYDEERGWYYYRYKSPGEAPGPRWFMGLLRDEPPYAQGYFLQALSSLYWYDEKLLASANSIWALLNSEYWIPTARGASEANVETQSSTAAGLKSFLEALAAHVGAGVEYVRGGVLAGLSHYEVNGTLVLTGEMEGSPGAVAAVALYIPRGDVEQVYVDGSLVKAVGGIEELSHTSGSAYYWDGEHRILYIKMRLGGSFKVEIRQGIHGTTSPSQPTTNTGKTIRQTHPTPPERAGRVIAALLLLALAVVLAISTLFTRSRPRT